MTERTIIVRLADDGTIVGTASLIEGRVVFGGGWGDGPDRRWRRAAGDARILYPEDGAPYLDALAAELAAHGEYTVEETASAA